MELGELGTVVAAALITSLGICHGWKIRAIRPLIGDVWSSLVDDWMVVVM